MKKDLIWCIKTAKNVYVMVILNPDLEVKVKTTKQEALYQVSLMDDNTQITSTWVKDNFIIGQ